MSILDLYCSVDAFWQQFEPVRERQQLAAGRRRRTTCLHPSEIMTILIHFQQSGYRTFKGYYTRYLQVHLRRDFPNYSATRALSRSFLASYCPWPSIRTPG